MSDQKPKILVFMLCRTGCIPYATQMVHALKDVDKFVFVSSFSPEALPKDNHKIRTYRNGFEFVLSTISSLPFLCFRLAALQRKHGFIKAYFPVFHHWNPVLIQICRWFGLEIIFTVHDGVLHTGEQRTWEQRLLNYCIRKSDKIIFLTAYVEKLTRKEIGFTAVTCIIPHPILKVRAYPKDLRTLPDRPSLLFLGRVVDYKGIDLLLEAMEAIPEQTIEKLTIAGRDYNGAQLPVPDNVDVVRINRWLSDDEMGELLSSHDILILPYKEASQSGIITLGIAAGIPMICTSVGGLTEQLMEKEAFFVEPTAEAIRGAILKLSTDPRLYKQIHTNLKEKRTAENKSLGKSLRDFLFE